MILYALTMSLATHVACFNVMIARYTKNNYNKTRVLKNLNNYVIYLNNQLFSRCMVAQDKGQVESPKQTKLN